MDDWEQLQFRLDETEQTRYELIRSVVVFGVSVGALLYGEDEAARLARARESSASNTPVVG